MYYSIQISIIYRCMQNTKFEYQRLNYKHIQQRNYQMLPKTPPKVKQYAPRKEGDWHTQRNIQNDRIERTGRNFSVDLDSHGQEVKFRKEIARLKERNDMLQNENMELHKLRIENQNQIMLWTQKARRLNDQLIRVEQESLREINQTKPYDENLKKQIQILSSQIKHLVSSKIELQQRLSYQKQKSQTLYRKCDKLLVKEDTIQELQAKVNELEQIVYKTTTEKQRCVANLTRTELYVSKLEGEVQYLTRQIKQQLSQLSEEKLELANKQKADALNEVKHFQHLLKTQQSKIQEQSLKIQELNCQLRRTKQELDEVKQEKRNELSRLRITTNESESVIKQLREENEIAKKSFELKITRLQSEKQQRESNIKKYEAQVSHLKHKVEQLKKLVQKKQLQKNKQIQESMHFKKQVQSLNQQISILNSQLKQKQQKIYQLEQIQVRETPKTERRQNSYDKQNEYKMQEKYFSVQHKNPDLEAQIIKFEENQRILVMEIQMLQRKLKQQRIQGQQLVQQLQMGHIEYQKLQLQLKKVLEQLIYMKEKDQGSVDLLKKIREQDALIVELTAQNQRWKSYRLSEEDEARRQARRHKKKVQQLQQQLLNQKNMNSEILQQLQHAHEALEQVSKAHQIDNIEQNKIVLNAALNEMEVEFRKLLNECEQKLLEKQKEIELKVKQIENYEIIMQKQKIQIIQIQKQRKANDIKNQQLRREIINVKEENNKLQNTLKKGQNDYKARAAIISQTQKEAKNRYEAAIEQKVVQVQRLKLELKDIQQQNKKEQTTKRQLQSVELKLRLKQKEELQKNERIRYLQKMIQTFEAQVRSYKNSKEELLGQNKNLQRELVQSKSFQQKMRSLENDLYMEKAKYQRLVQDKMRDQNLIQQLKQKYEDAQTIRQKINSTSNAKEKQLQMQIREIEKLLDQKTFDVEQLQSQCERYRSQIKNFEEKERFLKRQIQQIKYRSNAVEQGEKTRRGILEEKHYDNQAIIQEQKRMIQNMVIGQKQSHQEISILLEKIAILEAEIASKAASQTIMQEGKKTHRKSQLQKLARQCGLPYLDEDTTLGAVYQCITSMNAKMQMLQAEVNESRKLLFQLKQDKQNLSQKYLKYKTVAMQYKDRKQMQRLMLRNTYRFNDQILTHCQNIIKGSEK